MRYRSCLQPKPIDGRTPAYLEADPGESNNVAAEHPGIVRELWREMKETRTPSVIERWYIAETEGRPPVAETTPQHACFAWSKND